ncbi:hypothetical protein RhiTH_008984 [Rhizoctonia solani]
MSTDARVPINATQLLDLVTTGRVTTYRLVEGRNAEEMLRQIDKILADSKELLDDHFELLPKRQCDDFVVVYRRLKREACEENSQARLAEDEAIRRSKILSILYKGRATHQQRVGVLLNKAENFQGGVLQASRAADKDEMFPDEMPKNHKPGPLSSFTQISTWFGIPGSSSSSGFSNPRESEFGEVSNFNLSAPNPVTGGHRYLVSVSHIQQESDDGGVHRMYAVEGNGKRVVVIDPQTYFPDSHNPLTGKTL